jgi:AbrB family looped-hinge helix DNA binding protein
MNQTHSLEDHFYGVATVNERGQIVIPAEARKNSNIHPGDKIIVIGHPANKALLLAKMDTLREVMSYFLDELQKLEAQANETPEEQAGE